jgi:hypothetical protein
MSLSLKRQSIIFARLKKPKYDLASKLMVPGSEISQGGKDGVTYAPMFRCASL